MLSQESHDADNIRRQLFYEGRDGSAERSACHAGIAPSAEAWTAPGVLVRPGLVCPWACREAQRGLASRLRWPHLSLLIRAMGTKGLFTWGNPMGPSPQVSGVMSPGAPPGRQCDPGVLLMLCLPPSLQEELCLGSTPPALHPPPTCVAGLSIGTVSPVGGSGSPLGTSQPPSYGEPTTLFELSLMPCLEA